MGRSLRFRIGTGKRGRQHRRRHLLCSMRSNRCSPFLGPSIQQSGCSTSSLREPKVCGGGMPKQRRPSDRGRSRSWKHACWNRDRRGVLIYIQLRNETRSVKDLLAACELGSVDRRTEREKKPPEGHGVLILIDSSRTGTRKVPSQKA